ncbi:protein SFI1 homolog [Gracilinanus agilis]|uniref:protein SFI1 homolog n=1 Tax=Gracilinanus agilis TaxID=191870 RepID=UPI001CFE1019|nr:protein SFI1 homolog [Gracilinanus agilis]
MHPSPKGPRGRAASSPWQRTPSKGHSVPRRPSYTWNRGGRLRELRVRCLARKFFYLWVQQTFGRVCPSRARLHYERRLLQRTFEDWKEEWWVFQREWKLRVRADCHYRYFLYNLMFQTWQAYVHQRRAKKNKYRRAEDHAAKQKLQLAWKHWLIYVDVRRTKQGMRALALEFQEQSLLRVPWRVWRRQVQKVRVGHVMDSLALQHWAISLKFWAWSRWQEQFLCVQITRKKETKAVRHCEGRERRRALRAWRGYLQGRREKRRQDQLATQFHGTSVTRTCFSLWRAAWEQRQRLHAHQARIEALAARITLRRALGRWKRYMLISAEDAALRDMAEKHHRHRLVLRCFGALRQNVKNSRLQRLRKNLAHRQHQAMLLQRFWHRWCARADQREEEKQLPQLLQAHSHYRQTLLHKCLQQWAQNARGSRHEQMQYAKAEGHYRGRSLSVLFEAWRSFSCQRRERKAWQEEAVNFHRDLVKRRVFDTWWQKVYRQREARLSERMAVLHAERQVLRQCWSKWRRRAAEHSMERGNQATACAHRRHRQLQRAFRVWKENLEAVRAQQVPLTFPDGAKPPMFDPHREGCSRGGRARAGGLGRGRHMKTASGPFPSSRRAGEARAAAFNSHLLVRLAWSKWRQYVALQNVKWEKVIRADCHYHEALLRRTLTGWMTYQGRVQAVLRHVAEREEWHRRELLRWAFRLWRENSAAQVEEARKALQAEGHYRRTVLWKVAVHWRDAASLRRSSRQRDDVALMEARKRLARGRLRALFRRWRERGRRSSQQRAQELRAARHHRRRLLGACMARWKQHHSEHVQKMLLQRRGAQLMAQRLSRSCFSVWKCQLGERQRERQATVRALWFWSFTLQGKVWDAWLGFVLERRRKRGRLERAALAYHDGLVHEGVTRLLRFTTGMKSFRGQLQAQRQAQVAHSVHRVVRRCAALWKHKALARAARARRRVTFEVPSAGMPPPAGSAASGEASGEAAVGTEPSRAPRRPQKSWGWALQLASGDPYLPDPGIVRPVRKQPRRPDFLLDPVERAGPAEPPRPRLFSAVSGALGSARPGPAASPGDPEPTARTRPPEAPGHLHAESSPSSTPSERRPLDGSRVRLKGRSSLGQPVEGGPALPVTSWVSLDEPLALETRLSLRLPERPPLPAEVQKPQRAARWCSRGARSQPPGSAPGCRWRLLPFPRAPGRRPQPPACPGHPWGLSCPSFQLAAGVAPPEPEPQEPVEVVARMECAQPGGRLPPPESFPRTEGRPSQHLEAAGGSQAEAGRRASGLVGDGQLEAELEEIRERLCSYQANKQTLKSWQRQADSLRKWLELSTEDPRPEEEEAGLQVQQKLHQVEKQITHLAEELRTERQQVQRDMARIQALRAAFC